MVPSTARAQSVKGVAWRLACVCDTESCRPARPSRGRIWSTSRSPGRSSRQIERRCHEDIAFRVLAGNTNPDHVTIARFRVRHEHALAGFLVASLKLYATVGLVRLGVVALDGTKMAGNAADKANRTLAKLDEEVAQILRQAAEADQREDQLHGPARGDELPAELASPTGRLARLRQAKARLEAEAAERQRRYQQRVTELTAAAPPEASRPGRASSPGPATRRPAPTPRPIRPTPTAVSCAPVPGPCRATTPRRWSPSTRSWSRPS
jgi:hypothetical protein